MRTYKNFLVCFGLIPALAALLPTRAFAQGCDSTDECIGSALSLDGNAQYVDVPSAAIFDSVDSLGALTVEIWMDAAPQPGMTQIVAGKWGPRRDRDDEWLLLIDQNDTLRFRVSNGGSNAGDADNTEAKVSIAPFYDTWTHIAGVWDSVTKSVRLYVNGVPADSATNALYPPASLRRTIAYVQIGSFNGFANAPANYRTFKGQVDEIRIWNVRRPADSLRCDLFRRFTGAEPGLIAYWRCNGGADPAILCDAGPYGNNGLLRNGALVSPSSRVIPRFLISSVRDTLRMQLSCNTDTSVTFAITDTSVCGDRVLLSSFGIVGLTVAPDSAEMQKDVPLQCTAGLSTRAVGERIGAIVVRAEGSCSPPLVIPVLLVRNTPLTLSLGKIVFDTLFGCQAQQYEDTIVRLCNTSGGQLIITGAAKDLPEFDTTLLSGWQMPDTLQPGDCRRIRIRFRARRDSTYDDTLHIFSDDSCAGSGTVVLQGTVRNYLNAPDSIDFGEVFKCGAAATASVVVSIKNTGAPTLDVTAVQTQSQVFSSVALLPMAIRSGSKQDFLATMQAPAPGVYDDSLVIVADEGGCTIEHTIYVHARVVAVALSVVPPSLDFGNVFVGTAAVKNAVVKNTGGVMTGAFVSLFGGKVFHIVPPATVVLSAGDSALVGVSFAPTGAGMFYDTLVVQDTTCFNVIRIPLQGRGVNGPVVISPDALQFGTVFDCDCAYDTITIFNGGQAPLDMKSVAVAGAGFSLAPPPPPNETIQPGETRSYVVAFCGAGGGDGGRAGTVTFTCNDQTTPVLIAQLNAVRTSVRFNAPVFTDFGTVEINTSLDNVIKIQNASVAAVCVDSITAPPGFTVVAVNPPLPDTLGATRVLSVTVRFSPTAQTPYLGALKVYCSCPCVVVDSTAVKGVGAVLDVSFPWTTIVLPPAVRCDTAQRSVAIENPSHHPITIDTIFIGGPNAAAFAWQGVNFSGVPVVLDSLSADTVRFLFFPARSPLVFTNASLTIVATTIAGTDTFTVTLSGSRKLQFVPSDDSVGFGAVAVRTNAAAQNLFLYDAIGSGPVVIDSIYLSPDAGVFRLTYAPLPITLEPGDSLAIAVDFSPKAAIRYFAHIAVHVASPCPDLDSSIVVAGSGFTPVVLIDLCFDTSVTANFGDLFTLPVVASRLVPQTPVDVDLILDYDVRAVRLESVAADSCANVAITYTATGAIVLLRTCNELDSGAICDLTFRALVPDSLVATVAIDSVSFAADSARLLSLLAEGCGTTVTLNGHCLLGTLVPTDTSAMLAQNVPNPAAGAVLIAYQITEDVPVRIRIFDMLGREVAEPVDEFQKHGAHSVVWQTSGLTPGMYYYTIAAGVFHASRMMSVMR